MSAELEDSTAAPALTQPLLFAGDAGTLPEPTRRALVALLAGPAIDGRRQARLWTVLLQDEAILRSRLNDLFLELVVDREQQVAYTSQVVSEELDFPRLLRQMPLTMLDSALLLYLRHLVMQADAMGQRAVVSVAEMREHMQVYEPAGNTDQAGFDRRFNAALDKVKKRSLLHKIRGGEERYEISPTLKLVFGAAQIEHLAEAYRRRGQAGDLAPDPEIEVGGAAASDDSGDTTPEDAA